MSVPLVRLVLTASSILIASGVTRAGRRDSGVTITRRDGRVAKFLFMPDKTLASELQRLGATVTQD